MLTGQHDEVVVEVRATDGRRYRLIRESRPDRPTVHQLVLEPRDWPERFAMGARCAGIGALVTTLPPAVFVAIAAISAQPLHGGDWLTRDLPGVLFTCLLALGTTIGFSIGMFVSKRPHQLSIRFDSTVVVNGSDLGLLLSIESDTRRHRIILSARRGHSSIRLRSTEDVLALAAGLREALGRDLLSRSEERPHQSLGRRRRRGRDHSSELTRPAAKGRTRS